MSSGYSGTPLFQKLGIKEVYEIAILNAPKDYGETLGKFPNQVMIKKKLAGQLDLIQIFAKSKAELEKDFSLSRKFMKTNGAIWICWPKKSSGLASNLTGNVVREFGLRNGLVDVKVCSIDKTWSGLKFVVRLKDRQKA